MAASKKLRLGSNPWKEKELQEIRITEQENASKISHMESIRILEKNYLWLTLLAKQ